MKILIRTGLWMLLLLALWQPIAQVQAQSVQSSLRFFGHGVSDIDRVKIRIDAPPSPVDVGGDFTLEFWMKAFASLNTSPACVPGDVNWITGNTILDRDVYGFGDYGDYGVSLAGGVIAFGVANDNGAETICGNTDVADGAWHHIAVTRRESDGLLRIFVDGAQDAEGNGPTGDLSYRDGRATSYPRSDPFLVIGAEKHDAGRSFPSYNGWLDELRISNIVRYESGFLPSARPFVTDGNTVGLYHFDERASGACSGTVVDASGIGPSHGVCRYGGAGQAGPIYSPDTPFPTAPGIPVPLSPANNALLATYTPRLDWSNASPPQNAGFDRYELQVDISSAFDAPLIFDISGLENSEYTLPNPLEAGLKYYWRVRAWSDLGDASDWSMMRTFRTLMSPPVLSGPEAGAAVYTRHPTLDWDDVTGAATYTLQISSSDTFTRPLRVGTVRAPVSSYTPAAALPANTLLYWRVRANGVNGPSGYSEIRSFVTGNPPSVPVLRLPKSNALVASTSPFFDWTDSFLPPGTTFAYYQIQIARDNAFTEIVHDRQIADLLNSQEDTAVLSSGERYYWRVRAWNTGADNIAGSGDDEYSGWSPPRLVRVIIAPPLLTDPTTGEVVGGLRPLFTWDASTGATGYLIQVSRNASFTSLVVNFTIKTPTTEFTPPFNLPAGMQLWWRVRANGPNGPSAWSAVETFNTP